MASIQYQAAAEILEALDGAIRKTGGAVSMRRDELGGEPVFCFEYVSGTIDGKRYRATETVPWLVLSHLRAPAALADQVAAKWIAQTRKAADRSAGKANG